MLVLCCGVISITLAALDDSNGSIIGKNERASDIPYFIGHYMLSFFLACMVSLVLRVSEHVFELDTSVLAGYATGISFYISREIRDHEKLGFWDYEGLLAPVLGLSATFFIAQYCVIGYRKFVSKVRVTKFPIAFLAMWGIVLLACSIRYNYLFRGPFGPKIGGNNEPPIPCVQCVDNLCYE